MEKTNDYDVFEDDFFVDGDSHTYPTIGRWGVMLLHVMKGAFVLYSGAHNIQAALTATGGSLFASLAQIVGVLVLGNHDYGVVHGGYGRKNHG